MPYWACMTNTDPFQIYGHNRDGNWLVTCDHARNRVPDAVNNGDLGLPKEDMNRHIAYDVGAEGVAKHLGKILNSPVICANFSRLVIDPNRGEDDPTLLMRLYDGTLIPANRYADDAEIEKRLTTYHRPYHQAYGELLAHSAPSRAILSIHSFTPQLKGRPPRPWHVGILYAGDQRLSDPLLEVLKKEDDLCVGANQPYVGHLKGDAVDQHALQSGRMNALVEIRNDLIEHEEQQIAWAERLAPLFEHALKIARNE